MDTAKILNEFSVMLKSAIKEEGLIIKESADDVAIYMSERAVFLSTILEDPGYERAVIAERNNVAMFAGLLTYEATSSAQSRVIGMIGGAIRILAMVLA